MVVLSKSYRSRVLAFGRMGPDARFRFESNCSTLPPQKRKLPIVLKLFFVVCFMVCGRSAHLPYPAVRTAGKRVRGTFSLHDCADLFQHIGDLVMLGKIMWRLYKTHTWWSTRSTRTQMTHVTFLLHIHTPKTKKHTRHRLTHKQSIHRS